jgi:AraC family transcriptional regulator of adaptative response/methylated-DNA-[protein]-cysteine methyltransferase
MLQRAYRSGSPLNEEQPIARVCRYIDRYSDQVLTLDKLASIAGMSKFHFCRRFKSIVGVTVKQYAADARHRRFKQALKMGTSVDGSVYDAGYGSASRAYESAIRRLGMTPAQYRKAGKGVAISYATLQTHVGLMMIGATDRGICFVQFAESENDLEEHLRREYLHAEITRMGDPPHPEFQRWVDAIGDLVDGARHSEDLPLDIMATAFQMRVWAYLQRIPYGTVQSYAEVARGLGQPRAARAVANACARNPAAIVIPCHRVIRGSGDLAGYRWGVGRKRALIEHERKKR